MSEAIEPTERPVGDFPAYRMAFVLYHWPRPLIQRALLRSLLPKGTQAPIPSRQSSRGWTAGGHKRTKTRNRASDTFRQKLRDWESEGRISREGDWVRIFDRAPFAENAALLLLDKSLWLAEIVQAYRAEPVDAEIRRQELLDLQALMEDRELHCGSGRGTVRLLPRGRTL